MGGLRVKNVCLSEHKKKKVLNYGVQYRGQKTLKNRDGQLGFESGRILLRKDRKGYT